MNKLGIDRPLQKVSPEERNKNGKQFYKDTIDFYINTSIFGGPVGITNNARTKSLDTLYDVYNSIFPAHWFNHIMNPLNSDKPEYSNWAGKIRPTNILRPTCTLLEGEYADRPLNTTVVSKGDVGYNRYMESKKAAIMQNLENLVINTINQTVNPEAPQEPVEPPKEFESKFKQSYKDALAEYAQDWLDNALEELSISEKTRQMFKDWIIAGEAYSYKGLDHGSVVYKRISPKNLDYDKSPDATYIEDGEWVVARYRMNLSDIVDRFYDSISKKNIEDLEAGHYSISPANMYNFLADGLDEGVNKTNVYHVVWKGMQEIGFRQYYSEITGDIESDIVTRDYIPLENEYVEWDWITQILEGYRIGDQSEPIYVEMGPLEVQRNEINNLSNDKLPYNGKRYSDTHSENVSVLKLGIPYQILYIVLQFSMENTIAKNKDKIVLLDINTLPDKAGWDEEKFFYFAQATGFALIDRNKMGVDKSFNQYQVLDMGLYEHISNLIQLMDYCKESWDELLGITRQRKGQQRASDTVGGSQMAITQSTAMTEVIFKEFSGLIKRDLQGLVELSQHESISSKKSVILTSELNVQLLSVNSEEYSLASLGVHLTDSSKEVRTLERMRGYAQSMAQNIGNGVTMSSIMELEVATNMAKLKRKIQEMEDDLAKKQQEAAAAESQSAQELEAMTRDYDIFLSALETERMHEEYDRKEDLEIVKGDISIITWQGTTDTNGDGVADIDMIERRRNERSKLLEQERNNRTNNRLTERLNKQKMDIEKQKIKLKEKEIASRERIENKKAATALKNKVSGEK